MSEESKPIFSEMNGPVSNQDKKKEENSLKIVENMETGLERTKKEATEISDEEKDYEIKESSKNIKTDVETTKEDVDSTKIQETAAVSADDMYPEKEIDGEIEQEEEIDDHNYDEEIEQEEEDEEEEEEEEDEEIEADEEMDQEDKHSGSDFFVNDDMYSESDLSELSESDDNGKEESDKPMKREKKKKKKKKKDSKTKEKTSIYESVLSKLNVEKKTELAKSHIIVLGAKDVGKSCLVQALQKISLLGENGDENLYHNTNCILPLDYASLNVINFEENTKTKNVKGSAHVWIVEHSSYISSLVKHIKQCKNANIAVLMCTDLYKPYNIISDLNHWIESLYILFEEFQSDSDLEVYNKMKEKLEDYIYNYKEKKMQEKKALEKKALEKKKINKGNNPAPTTETVTNDEENDVELDKKSLVKINLGFPICFVICKSDGYEILNNRTYQGYIDVIIAYLRNLAIYYQASIVFCNNVNAKDPQNMFLLYKYVMHRLYDFPFSENEILDNYEKIFIPSGYDTTKMINESIKNTFVGNFNKPYDSIITKPVSNKNIVEHSHNIVADVHFNDFLASIKQEISSDDEGEKHKNNDFNNTNRQNHDGNNMNINNSVVNETNDGDGITNDTGKDNPVDGETLKTITAVKKENYDNLKKKGKLEGATLSSNQANGPHTHGSGLHQTTTGSLSSSKKESLQRFSLNSEENNDQSLHSFFQNLLAKGRTKPQNPPNTMSNFLEKKN